MEDLIVTGVVKKIIFQKEDFYILHLETTEDYITVLGELYQISPGDEISIWGKWTSHQKYGKQLKVEGFKKKIPTSIEAIEEYLASDVVKGIGPKTAKKIIEAFGENSLQVAQNEPEKLATIKGITVDKAKEIANCLKEALEFQQVMLELLPLGLTVKTIIKIYQQFGGSTLPKLAENPYILTTVPQIGFIKADNIARSMNIPFNSIHRIKAGIEYVLLEEASQNGHLYLEKDYLVTKAINILENDENPIEEEQLGASLSLLEIEGKIIIEDDIYIYWNIFHFWERESGRAVCQKLFGYLNKFDIDLLKEKLKEYQQKQQINLANKQVEAILMACVNRICIITGGPGTGKTQTVKAIIDIWKKNRSDKKILLAAPTGRAARRMKEVTGEKAVTIHRLLKLGRSDNYSEFDDGDNVEADLLVVDEFSMVDMHLFYQLITSVGEETTLVFIGDTDQLPSVGPGSVLSELIRANVPMIMLTEIFRQAHESQIVVNAHRCNKGEGLIIQPGRDDFYFIKEEDNAKVSEKIVQAVERLIAKGKSIEDIQVLSPMKKTETGVENLNKCLQAALNPHHPLKEKIETKNHTYRVGDKVMQIINNYDKGVFNGDVGIIYQIENGSGDNPMLEVMFDDRLINYKKEELEELNLAYAITVHKSQGSEYPVVIMPISTQHYVMLARNLLYTGITRAREKVVLLGTAKAVNIAIRNNKVLKRNSKLAERIK
ncbi:MAG: ATP-dependent RecD-like DNA helicase [Bacillota bacterium]|nr:ATP-dependent RecD-like DNA helicase [Bacillota bacterium]